MIKYLLFFIFFQFVLINVGISQTNSTNLKGLVTSKNVKLSDVVVNISNTDSSFKNTTTTQSNGTFLFKNIPPGTYSLNFRKLGFKDTTFKDLKITKEIKEFIIPTITLIAAIKNLNEVIVSGNVPTIQRRSGKTILNVENSVFATGSSGFEILQIAPGVSIDNNEQISIKGKSGVVIYIDGKPSNLSKADLVEYLKNIPTNNIDQIEIISVPSAKYDAAGNAGIINIKFKKGKNVGTSATYSAGGGIGRNYRYNTGLSLNNRGKRTNFYGNFDYSKIKTIDDNYLNRTITTNNVIYDIKNADLKGRGNYNLNLGFDYNVKPGQTIGVLLNGFINKLASNENNLSNIYSSTRLDSSIISTSYEERNIKNGTINLNYVGSIGKKGTKISADADYLRYKRTSNEAFSSNYKSFTPPYSKKADLNLVNQSPSNINLGSFKADLTQPLKKDWFLDAGFKFSMAKIESERIFDLITGKNPFPSIISNFDYKENINAAYFIFRKKKEKSNLEFQLRTEQTIAKGTSGNGNELINRNYWSFFPVFLYSRDVNKNDRLSFSYNRRVNRPDYQDLNPFIYFLDQKTYSQGNPSLKPTYANSFEINYTIKDTYSFSLQYNHIKDFMYTVYQQNDNNQVAITTRSNFDYRKTIGFEFDIPKDITKWLSIDLSLQNYYEFFKYTSTFSGEVKNRSFSGLYNLNATFKLPKGYNALLNLHYETPLAYAIYQFKPLYFANFGLSKSIFKKAGNVRFTFTDIFDTNSYRYSSNLYNLDLVAKEKRETRSLRLSFSYKFGNTTVKGERKRKVGVDDEKARIKD
nr:outer membrane beta-barrel protein [Pseudopedobacter sp.]